MKARTSSIKITACLLALLAVGLVVYLEGPTVVAAQGERFEFGGGIEHPFGETTVKGAPFSAQVTFENPQTLANNSHVAHKMTGALYRDSEGRTRQELPRDGAPEAVLINDNVAIALRTSIAASRLAPYSKRRRISASPRRVRVFGERSIR